MTPAKKRRLWGLGLGLVGIGTAAALALTALQDTVVFFYAPADIAADHVAAGKPIRLGGMVAAGSVQKEAGDVTHFVVTDFKQTVPVTYRGVLPDLFREGQGVVAEGRLGADGTFQASSVLAKHDERYMPPEVAKAVAQGGEQKHRTDTLVEGR